MPGRVSAASFGDLRAGDRVIIRGNERLRPGQPLVMDQFLTR